MCYQLSMQAQYSLMHGGGYREELIEVKLHDLISSRKFSLAM